MLKSECNIQFGKYQMSYPNEMNEYPIEKSECETSLGKYQV